jgi:hypothetical protein
MCTCCTCMALGRVQIMQTACNAPAVLLWFLCCMMRRGGMQGMRNQKACAIDPGKTVHRWAAGGPIDPLPWLLACRYVVTYSEPVEVVEPTVVAALNMNYPGAKLAVHVLDDGCRREVAKMARRLSYQCRWGQ